MSAGKESTGTLDPLVSFDDEALLLVNEADDVLGYRAKDECHRGRGLRRRAFSIFLFDDAGAVLLQRRATQKRLWPGYWSNSCCSHPRRGETVDEAVRRRTREELGIDVRSLRYLFKFRYRAFFEDQGAEYELCWVFVGRTDGDVAVNSNEIEEWRWVAWRDMAADIVAHPERYTPWMAIESEHIGNDHWCEVADCLEEAHP